MFLMSSRERTMAALYSWSFYWRAVSMVGGGVDTSISSWVAPGWWILPALLVASFASRFKFPFSACPIIGFCWKLTNTARIVDSYSFVALLISVEWMIAGFSNLSPYQRMPRCTHMVPVWVLAIQTLILDDGSSVSLMGQPKMVWLAAFSMDQPKMAWLVLEWLIVNPEAMRGFLILFLPNNKFAVLPFLDSIMFRWYLSLQFHD